MTHQIKARPHLENRANNIRRQIMNNLEALIKHYLEYCNTQKRLDSKTLKAYNIDLRQFSKFVGDCDIENISSEMLESYIGDLHNSYKPKTVKRKIASLKSFFHHLEYKEMINRNPFNRIQIRFREPVILPKTIPLHTVEKFLTTIYRQRDIAKTEYQRKNSLRDAAVIELLFATGMRISELCALKSSDINLYDGSILIYGKGSKERKIQIGTVSVINILKEYSTSFRDEINSCNHFFANQSGTSLSDQAVRRMINKYAKLASIDLHITPHMFRHTFATSLLEADVDIRYIQEMLGHSSINITEIYTHVALAKQKSILSTKHPRNNFNI
jgi:integrase/recombinase XerD